ncbi:MAG: DNA-binding protein WhiA [Ruminococcaceae bacterium]|jgi:hypothetical protein|nr:DNA-binding protein WhiA [Oscillospiraceae bacterium]
MSFSSNAKAELCRAPISRRCCALAEAYGVVLYCNTFRPDQLRIVTENPEFSARLPRLFKRAFGLEFDQLPVETGGKRIFHIGDPAKLRAIFDAFGISHEGGVALHVNYGMLEDDCCRVSFLRGAFLAGGSATDPAKRYHLELATSHRMVSRETDALLLDLGFRAKTVERNGSSILYFKQSEGIEDFLTFLGAPVCAMAVMEAKMEKELINGVNRRVNCETANLSKVVNAAGDQIDAIRLLERRGILETLPEKLQITAQMRLRNPEATLAELAGMSNPPVSKSAINHRMRKLVELAKE